MQIKVYQKKRRRIPLKPTVILALIFAVLVLLHLITGAGEISFWRYYGLNKTLKYNLVIEGVPIGSGVTEQDGILYIDLDAVREHIDPNIYYNDEENRVIITTANEVLRFSNDAAPTDLNFPVFSDSGEVYLPVSLVESVYGTKHSILNDSAVLSLDTVFEKGVLTQNTRLYSKPEKKNWFTKLKSGADLYIYSEENGYTLVKVMDDNETGGFVGYIRSGLIEPLAGSPSEPVKSPELWEPDGKIILAFDQISNAAGASATMSGGVPEGVNVLCPTWFSFKDAGGEIINKANMDYVNWAHENGLQVWGLITDNFDSAVSHAVITDDNTREYVIQQLLAYAQTYGLDGINIDFESVPGADSSYWIQFLRELVPVCHQNGLAVSVDLFVPKPWTAHYDRRSVGETADYAIVMGYDEHYSGSDSAGSVASYDWSVTAVRDTLNAGVPAEKLVLGVPFYTRIWLEKAEGGLDSKAYSMDAAMDILEENEAVFSYDEETQQTYAEYTDAEGRHRCWLEDEEIVKKRAELVNEHDIAGIAAWKLRMERAGIFHAINSVLSEN